MTRGGGPVRFGWPLRLNERVTFGNEPDDTAYRWHFRPFFFKLSTLFIIFFFVWKILRTEKKNPLKSVKKNAEILLLLFFFTEIYLILIWTLLNWCWRAEWSIKHEFWWKTARDTKDRMCDCSLTLNNCHLTWYKN